MCNTDVSIMLFFFIKPEPYFTTSLAGMKKKPLLDKRKNNQQKAQTTPKETRKLPRGLKAEFQGKCSCVPYQKERGSRNIQWNTHSQTEWRKMPPVNIRKRAEMWKDEKIQTKTTFKIYYMEWWVILQRLIQTDVSVPAVLPLVLCPLFFKLNNMEIFLADPPSGRRETDFCWPLSIFFFPSNFCYYFVVCHSNKTFLSYQLIF